MRIADKWTDFEIIDAGNGVKIERYGDVVLKRPDPLASWPLSNHPIKVDASFEGSWIHHNDVSVPPTISYHDMVLAIKPTDFKHTGIFPEQAVNWDWMRNVIRQSDEPLRILNLFGYTGGATIACALEDNAVEVVHIDALKSLNTWVRNNVSLNHLDHKTIRTITEDALKFLDREKRRGRTYHGIIMDPPSYGKGPKGEVWRIEQQLPTLLDKAFDLLDPHGKFVVLNTYTTNLGSSAVQTLFNQKLAAFGFPLNTHSEAIGLPITYQNKPLACGITTRWSYDENLLRR